MIAVGEESGRLSEVLEEIHNSYSQQIEADIALVTSLIEPVLILVLGLILGTIVLSILLPTFQITQMVR
jgi:general secretion pathway protein F